jgi:23S rRNA (guanosine2251-2'-O)-methyltransferase
LYCKQARYDNGMNLIVIAHNIRSTHNIGAILRTADGFGVKEVWLTGYSPYPTQANDTRLPHLRDKITKQIHKTALGAEVSVVTRYVQDVATAFDELRQKGYSIVALEQDAQAIPLAAFKPATSRLAVLLGEEVAGVDATLLATCDAIVEIPMHGHKESFNVSVAAGIALYELSKPRK